MTAKRFTYEHFDWLQWHIFDNGEFYIEVTQGEEDAKKLCDLLNALHEENEQLQIEKDTCKKQHEYELTKKIKYKSQLIDLKKENEQLKKELAEVETKLYKANDELFRQDDYLVIKEENKQLKSENQRLEKIIEELNYELTELKQSNDDNYNITDGLW